jgi:hypothetical protein
MFLNYLKIIIMNLPKKNKIIIIMKRIKLSRKKQINGIIIYHTNIYL